MKNNKNNNEIIYNNFIINYSKAYKNKISVFDLNNNFYGDFYNIISAKFAINSGELKKLN